VKTRRPGIITGMVRLNPHWPARVACCASFPEDRGVSVRLMSRRNLVIARPRCFTFSPSLVVHVRDWRHCGRDSCRGRCGKTWRARGKLIQDRRPLGCAPSACREACPGGQQKLIQFAFPWPDAGRPPRLILLDEPMAGHQSQAGSSASSRRASPPSPNEKFWRQLPWSFEHNIDVVTDILRNASSVASIRDRKALPGRVAPNEIVHNQAGAGRPYPSGGWSQISRSKALSDQGPLRRPGYGLARHPSNGVDLDVPAGTVRRG